MSKILNPLQIVASALSMRPSASDPQGAASDSDEPPERKPAPSGTRRAKRSGVSLLPTPAANPTGR